MSTSYIRWILTIALLFGVSSETGLWTTIVISLICIKAEVEIWRNK